MIRAIDSNAIWIRTSKAAGITDWIWAIAGGRRDRDRHDVVDEQGRGRDQSEDRRRFVLATTYAPPPFGYARQTWR